MHAIYIAYEHENRQQFQSIACDCTELDSLHLFADAEEALAWAGDHFVDIAFVDAGAPDGSAVAAAKQLIQSIRNVRVVLLASDARYALDAWQIEASGYLIKPCTAEQLQKELANAGSVPFPPSAL